MFGTEGLCHWAGKHHYSEEIKCEAVEVYLSGRMSEEEICKKYQEEHEEEERKKEKNWVLYFLTRVSVVTFV